MQTTVLKISLTFDPKALVSWAKDQKGVCCDEPAHDPDLLDAWEPELSAQSILAHTILTVLENIIEGGSVGTLETGIPQELSDRIDADYEASLREAEAASYARRERRCWGCDTNSPNRSQHVNAGCQWTVDDQREESDQ